MRAATAPRESSVLRVLAWGVIAIALVYALQPSHWNSAPLAGEATGLMMAESLALDGDLIYESRDLERAVDRWSRGPRGLRLVLRGDRGELVYAGSPIYPWIVRPFVALFGVTGAGVLNAALFAGLLAWGRRRWPASPALAVAYFVLSSALLWVLLPQPYVLTMALVALGFAGFGLGGAQADDEESRLRSFTSGVAWALAVALVPVVSALPLLLLVDAAVRRRWRSILILIAGGLAGGAMVLALMQWTPGALGVGEVGSQVRAMERVFIESFPEHSETFVESFWSRGAPLAKGRADLRRFAIESWYLLAGRDGGLLVRFPALLVLLLVALVSVSGRRRFLLLLGVVALFFAAVSSWSGTDTLAVAAMLPAVFVLVSQPPGRWVQASALLLAACLTLPALVAALLPGDGPMGLAQKLPAELTRLNDPLRQDYRVIEGKNGRWLIPRRDLVPGSDLWLRGNRRSELWLVSRRPLEAVRWEVSALGENVELRVDSSGESHLVRFDSESKRAGTPLNLPLTPAGRDLGVFFGGEAFYPLKVTIRGGKVTSGGRFLGVKLELDS